MAGARKSPQPNGKFMGWFMDSTKRQKFFAGTESRAETLRQARDLESQHRKIRLGLAEPNPAAKHRSESFQDTLDEYLAWGAAQGGRGERGRKPWAKRHLEHRRKNLTWWGVRLGLNNLADLDGSLLGRAEKALRELQAQGYAGKSLQNRAEALHAFCLWALKRNYLGADPLRGMEKWDCTPKTQKRALTLDELRRLLAVVPEDRALIYATAYTTGLRRGELKALRASDLDHALQALRVRAEIAKSRKSTIQKLPGSLYIRLADAVKGKSRDAALFTMPGNLSERFDRDLALAAIPKETAQGRASFHSLRYSFCSHLIEWGATAKEAQDLARHSTPLLTLGVYAKSRDERLHGLVEKLGEALNFGENYAQGRTEPELAAEAETENVFTIQALAVNGGSESAQVQILYRPP